MTPATTRAPRLAPPLAPTSAKTGNRRRNFRYRFVTEVTYCTTTASGAALVGRGTTIDMSASGILVELDRSWEAGEPGSTLQLSLPWPGLYHNCDYARLDLACEVLRAEGKRVAVQIRAHEFRLPRVPRGSRPTERRMCAGAAA